MSEDLKDLYEDEKELIKERKRKRKKRRIHDLGNYISGTVIIVCVIVFCISAFKLYQIYDEYKAASDEYSDLAQLIPTIEVTTEEQTESEAVSSEVQQDTEATQEVTTEEVIVPAPVFMEGVDWQALYNTMYSINSDYEAWIYIADTKINYPIVQGTDNDFYLNHTFYKEPVFSASLFIDYRIEGGAEGKNVIVYGHNMKDGSMFASLKKFRQKEFRQRHPSFSVYTSTGAYEYQVFSTYTTSPDSVTYTVGFANDEEFMNYINIIKNWSDTDYGVEVTAEDQIITLSTCVNDNVDRYVVHAKRVN